MTSMEPEKITQKLFDDVMRGYWNGVAETYKQYPFVHATKITNSEDTALHIAVYNGQEDIVEKLVLGLEAGETTDVLKLENEMGNTPLHLAAVLGSVKMCECIAKKDRELISARNRDGETPLFLAALNGNKDAFLCLHNIWGSVGREDYKICIRDHDGESILHSAIAGEYFDLALQIIHRYEKLVNHTDKYGFTPLHILASKPSAFRSGSHLGWFYKIIYFCTFVDELEVEKTVKRPDDDPRCYTYETKYPENYRTCINIFGLLMNLFRVLFNFKQKEPVDSERQVNPKQEEQVHSEREDAEGEKVLKLLQAMDDPQVFPPNNTTCFEVIKVIMSVLIMLIILGIGIL